MIYNEDCIEGSKKYIKDNSVDLLICDPPFGINESSFNFYERDESTIIQGYVEAPKDYYQFTVDWLTQAKRVMKPDGSMYLVSGWSKLKDVLIAIDEVGLNIVNHLIWKFNFGLATKKKFITSHYHILYLCKGKKRKFNTYCRFTKEDKTKEGRSLNYRDLEGVFSINREYQPGVIKNKNKLPDALIEKLISYSSDPGDVVCDFFLGNFTTANVAKKMGRIPCGFELNKESFDYHMARHDKNIEGQG